MRVVLAAAAACIALAACGDDSSPDLGDIERDLAEQVGEHTATPDVSVACPDDAAEGDTCDVTAPGGVRARVKIVRLEDGDVEGEVVQP